MPISETACKMAQMIDHALLHPTLTETQILKSVQSVRVWPLASICVKPSYVSLVVNALSDSEIETCTVIGFPHGSNATSVKLFETETALSQGASEIDMVVNIGRVLGDEWSTVEDEIACILDSVRQAGALLKVIFENDYLPDDAYIIRLCEICSVLEVDYVKTSTGFGYIQQENGMARTYGASKHHLELMRQHTASHIGIKASGGIKTLLDMESCISAGATRIGTSSTSSILSEITA